MSAAAQFLFDAAGEPTAVILPIAEYEKLLHDRRPPPRLTGNATEEESPALSAAQGGETGAAGWSEALIGDVADDPLDFTTLEAAMIGAGLAQSDPQRMSGAVCFVEAPRLPIEALFANLEAGDSIEDFLENYPDDLSRETIDKALAVQRRLLQAAGVEE